MQLLGIDLHAAIVQTAYQRTELQIVELPLLAGCLDFDRVFLGDIFTALLMANSAAGINSSQSFDCDELL